jgi:alkylation response protein AidB-like acyl-CoA dehydrogenase
MGYKDIACVLEECGRNLVPEPLLSTVLLGANAILLSGSDRQKEELLPLVASGRLLLALAYHERGARHDVHVDKTRAVERGGTYALSGTKVLVFDGHAADKLIVAARTSGSENDRDGIRCSSSMPARRVSASAGSGRSTRAGLPSSS